MKFYEQLEHWAFLLRSKALYYELKYYVRKKQTHIKNYILIIEELVRHII